MKNEKMKKLPPCDSNTRFSDQQSVASTAGPGSTYIYYTFIIFILNKSLYIFYISI